MGSIAGAELPEVHLLSTGGTIAVGPTGSLNAVDLVECIPELDKIAKLTVEDIVNIGSSLMTPEIQFGLAQRINNLITDTNDPVGIVVTHGTDSLEETAFFVDLLVSSDTPIVFTAAQRPPRESDSDGPRNLLNAVRLAVSPLSRGMGVIVTLNNEIHTTRDVRKTHASALDAFRSPWIGPLGIVDGGKIYFLRKPLSCLTLPTDFIESRVDLIRLYTGSDGHLVRAAVKEEAQGIVVEIFGRGNVPFKVMEAVRMAMKKGVKVVFTTRTGGGMVILEEEACQLGIISGCNLDGLKARILMIVALGKTRDSAVLQSYFRQLSGEVNDRTIGRE